VTKLAVGGICDDPAEAGPSQTSGVLQVRCDYKATDNCTLPSGSFCLPLASLHVLFGATELDVLAVEVTSAGQHRVVGLTNEWR
jgi:hypothetical protein